MKNILSIIAGRRLWLLAAVVALVLAAYFGRDWLMGSRLPSVAGSSHGDGHAGHDHSHAGHDEGNSLELSNQARNNIGLQLLKVELRPFEKIITIPGMVVERPGQSTIEVTAPMTGVITRIAAIQGQAVTTGQVLFEMRLTHEELVQAQGEFLRTAEELDVTLREIKRIEKLAESGAIPGKTLIERNYEKQKSEALLRAQSQALLLHGLSKEQVDDILTNRKLLQKLTVVVPETQEQAGSKGSKKQLQVQQLKVEQGQHVTAGDTLCVLVDHEELYIEGSAFEQDVEAVSRAAAEDWQLSAVVESKSAKPQIIDGLRILYLADKVDSESRAFHFYVLLPNRLLRRNETADKRQFISWQFKPGQRIQIRVPVERWPDRIVLPIEAVASDGAETFVFQANGDHFDRRPVHVEYRDQFSVVIANDGSIYPGDTVASSGAYQLQTALKNKSGGAIDPHAGHNH